MYVLRWKLISCRGKCNVKNLIKITKQYQFHNKFDRLSGLKFQDGKSIPNMSEIQRKKPKKYSNYFQTVSCNFSVWIDKAPTTHTSHHHDMQKKLKLEKASRSLSNEKVYMRRTHMRRNAWVKLPPAAAASYPGTDPGCSVSDLLMHTRKQQKVVQRLWPGTHVRYLEVPGSQPWSGSVPAVVAFWSVSQKMEELSFSFTLPHKSAFTTSKTNPNETIQNC